MNTVVETKEKQGSLGLCLRERHNPNLVKLMYRNKVKGYIQRNCLLFIYEIYNISRGSKKRKNAGGKIIYEYNGIMNQIKKNNLHSITYSEIKNIFKDKWFHVFADISKIQSDFQKENGHKIIGTIRGISSKPIYSLEQYISHNIMNESVISLPSKTNSIEQNALNMANFLGFDLNEYRNIYKKESPNRALQYFLDLLDKKGIYIFVSYDMCNVIPMKIGKHLFDGIAITTDKRNRAICLSAKVPSYERRVATAASLLYSFMSDSEKVTKIYDGEEYEEVISPHYKFTGYLFLKKSEIERLRAYDFSSWQEIKNHAKKFGLSPSFLNYFLFNDFDKGKYESILRMRPNSPQKKSNSAPPWDFKTTFMYFYSKGLYKKKMSQLQLNGDFRKILAKKMIATGTDKEKMKKFNQIVT